MSDATENNEGIVTFENSLDITVVATYLEKLTEMLEKHKSIVLNGGELERVDGAGLQLLLAFFNESKTLNISVKWQECSEVLKKSAHLSGLTGTLEIT